jgi:hypothetical protein
MPHPDFIARHSRFFENLLEHRFLFDLGARLVLAPEPRLLNVLKSEVDAYGFDFVLSVADRSVHVQMKTRSGTPSPTPYNLSETLWSLPNACAIWMLYDSGTLNPTSYFILGFPMPDIDSFVLSGRAGYRSVRMQRANHRRVSLDDLAGVLFPSGGRA